MKKPLIPTKVDGEFVCAILDSGHEFSMYPLSLPNFIDNRVAAKKNANGYYELTGDARSINAVVVDQNPLTKAVWAAFYLHKSKALAKRCAFVVSLWLKKRFT